MKPGAQLELKHENLDSESCGSDDGEKRKRNTNTFVHIHRDVYTNRESEGAQCECRFLGVVCRALALVHVEAPLMVCSFLLRSHLQVSSFGGR